MTIDGFGYGVGIIGVVIFVVWLLFIVGVVALVILAVRWFLRQERREDGTRYPVPPPAGTPGAPAAPTPPPSPLDILRERYARGEIDDEEYERRRKNLGG